MVDVKRPTWEDTYLVGYIWWCGDEQCDCTQPVIERVSPNLRAGRLWIHRESVWQGSFHSQVEPAESVQQRRELWEAVATMDEPVWTEPYGI